MNKMLSLFFSGCALIGVGVGVFFMELKDWKVVDYNPQVMDMPQETYTKIINFDTTTSKQVEISYSQPYSDKIIKLEEDESCTDKLKIEVVYRGAKPDVFPSDNSTHAAYYHMYVSTYNKPDGEYDFYDICKSIFYNKTYYSYNNNTYIDSVTLYTAHPENIQLSGMGLMY